MLLSIIKVRFEPVSRNPFGAVCFQFFDHDCVKNYDCVKLLIFIELLHNHCGHTVFLGKSCHKNIY